MTVVDWIEAKKDGKALPVEAIRSLVAGFTSGQIPDYQMSAFLMAVAIRGMTLEETVALTGAMVDSGKVLDLSAIPGVKLDKHSSGGVGDKVTLALVPILAAAGVPMVKMSGHGLGLTGGTLDKLESIPGFRTQLSEAEILSQVKRIGACICAQTDTLAPADRAMYALRDVTGSVASIPLIASSILSKKIACGADAILLDIKVGSGAFMKNLGDARRLAETCIAIGKAYGKQISAFLTDMDQPLGRAVGNFIEIQEVASLLSDDAAIDRRLRELTMTLSREALRRAGSPADPEALIESGEALDKAAEIVAAQGGDPDFVTRTTMTGCEVTSKRSGFIHHIDAYAIAKLVASLGGGREQKSDSVDPFAGVHFNSTPGEPIRAGEVLATLYSSDPSKLNDQAKSDLLSAYTIDTQPPSNSPLVLDHLTSDQKP